MEGDPIVHLSVQGSPVDVPLSVLQATADGVETGLTALFRSQERIITSDTRRHFIDCHPDAFNAIVNYHRRGGDAQRQRPLNMSHEAWNAELDYWCIEHPKTRPQPWDCATDPLLEARTDVARTIWRWIEDSSRWRHFLFQGGNVYQFWVASSDTGPCLLDTRYGLVGVREWLAVVGNRSVLRGHINSLGYKCTGVGLVHGQSSGHFDTKKQSNKRRRDTLPPPIGENVEARRERAQNETQANEDDDDLVTCGDWPLDGYTFPVDHLYIVRLEFDV
ncbi:BTB/POZ domain-containing protein [Medusavirus stheno T3]|uniref:BTB/POZ domain-containing protein n=1 Tax=Medusavirus stheno T3 TaxID=3069717 RepID=A0A7S7YES5_9VIRU|nr:BTB/POZ domain-containing protein [Acanthamoeba castellanii medusavirus]QPB44462.1 BTB/POZ domain-containing protein [Medusavirus stheno T3]